MSGSREEKFLAVMKDALFALKEKRMSDAINKKDEAVVMLNSLQTSPYFFDMGAAVEELVHAIADEKYEWERAVSEYNALVAAIKNKTEE